MLSVKPLSDFSVLDKHLSLAATRQPLLPQNKLSLTNDSPKVTFICKGTVKIERAKGDIVVWISTGPVILGLPGILIPSKENYQLTALTECETYQLETDQCAALIEKHQLWREAFNWISWQCRMQEQRDIQLIGRTSYSQIRSTLQSMEQWDKPLLAQIGVMNYIQQRTRISRSVIAEVLAALRAGDYIKMDKGKLVTINRLPLEY